MRPDRAQLDSLRTDALKETSVAIEWKQDRRTYVLKERLGPGLLRSPARWTGWGGTLPSNSSFSGVREPQLRCRGSPRKFT